MKYLSPLPSGAVAPGANAAVLPGDVGKAMMEKGDVVLLNMWATWCAPCRFETPYLQAVYEENQDRNLMIVGVSVDSPSALDQVNDFLEEMGVTYDILLDPGMVSTDSFMPQGYPTSYLIDGEGVIRFARIGPIPEGDAEFLEALEQTLGG